MLLNMQVRDFAIVDRIDVEFDAGMTVLTGETGAGKSILVDALGLVLGERGSPQLVRDDAKRAEFSAEFDIANVPSVRAWLVDQALDENDECALRRVIGADGRSRAFINGNSVPLSQLKSLGELLVDIHGQHFHQSLGRRSVQRDLLDHFGGLLERRESTQAHFATWRSLADRLQHLRTAEADRASRLDLLGFQLQELDALALAPGEVDDLRAERQKLQHSGRLAEGVAGALDSIFESDAGNANSFVSDALHSLEPLLDYDTSLSTAVELLNGASIQLTEAADLLRRYCDSIDMDPQHRDSIEERLDSIQEISRKHRVGAETLPGLTETLRAEYDELNDAEQTGRQLEQEVAAAKKHFLASARELSKERKKASRSFTSAVTKAMRGLGMPDGVFEVAITKLDDAAARPWGIDEIDFLISANPGQPVLPLAKIASGGELSRMSLAIQVIASDGSAIPTMVFDEVDSGVGGGVAEMVGRRLQELGARRQVLCVTHLPQVASLASQHFRVSKVSDGKSTRTRLQILEKSERVEELARMLGGVEITRKTLAHAAEMLADAPKKRA